MNFDRSLAFTSLLDLSPQFGRLPVAEGSAVITDLVTAWQASPSLDFHRFTKRWLEEHPIPEDAGMVS